MNHTAPQAMTTDRAARDEAERAVVGSIFACPERQADIFSGFNDPGIFNDDQLAMLFGAARDVFNRGSMADIITIRARLEETEGRAPDWFNQLVTDLDNPANTLPGMIEGWKRIIVEDERFATFKQGAARARSIEDVEKVAIEALKIHGILSGDDEPEIGEAVERFINRQVAIKAGDERAGFSWGINGLDQHVLLKAGCLHVVAGIKKGAKSQFVLSVIRQNLLIGNPCALFSLEMAIDAILTRWAATETGINSRRILSKHVSEEDIQEITRGALAIADWPIRINQSPSIGVAEIGARARSWKQTERVPDGAGLVAVDFLQLVRYEQKRGGGSVTEASQIKTIAYDLARIAKELKVAVLAVVQFKNEAEGQRPQMRFIEGSGGIAQASEAILLLDLIARREDRHDPNDWTDLDVIVYQRNGESGIRVPLEVSLKTTQFRDRGIVY